MTTEFFFNLDEHELNNMSPAPSLMALWHDFHENWDTAHEFVQDDSSNEASWVHAYLHRKEGDASNARYWYRRAGKPPHKGSLDLERDEIAGVLLGDGKNQVNSK